MASANPFRKESLEKMNSPEQLNDYIKVANPAVWLILALTAFLLGLFLLWAFYGKIDITESTVLIAKDGEARVYVSAKYTDMLEEGLAVDSFTRKMTLLSVPAEPVQITTSFDANAKSIAGMQNGDLYYPCILDAVLDNDGCYSATVHFKSMSPVEYLRRWGTQS